jgi:acyl-[acyl carrier protein]--UDP-N-acetylglucosamine O-acyltransferase
VDIAVEVFAKVAAEITVKAIVEIAMEVLIKAASRLGYCLQIWLIIPFVQAW